MPEKISILFLIFTLSFTLALIAGQDKELEEKKKRLLEVQQQINEEKEREEKARVDEKKEKQVLEIVNKNLKKTSTELEKYKKEIVFTKKDLRITEINLERKEKNLCDYQDLLTERISVFFKNIFFPSGRWGESKQGYLDSFSYDCVWFYNARDEGRGLKVFSVFAGENADLIRQTELEKEMVEGKKKTLRIKEVKLTQVKVVKEKEKKELESKKKEKEYSISKAKTKLKEAIKKQESLRKSARELEAMIKKFAAKKGVPSDVLKKEAMVFERDKDNLLWPVSKGKVVNYFGWSSSQQYTTSLFNPGIDIEVNGTENVCAVSKGKIIFSKTFRSYGETIIIDHGGGYCSVYGGLDQILIKTNQDIKSGQVVGNVSSTLHFEIRKDAKSIDPLEWLKNK